MTLFKPYTGNIVSICLFLFSCNNADKQKNPKIDSTVVGVSETTSGIDTSIHLNKGRKWKVETKMLGFIHNMENELKREECFSDLNSYKKQGLILKANIDSLTSNCVMEGEAHDELHKWLVPYIDLVDSLSKTSDTGNASKLQRELKNSFNTFNYYFE